MPDVTSFHVFLNNPGVSLGVSRADFFRLISQSHTQDTDYELKVYPQFNSMWLYL